MTIKDVVKKLKPNRKTLGKAIRKVGSVGYWVVLAILLCMAGLLALSALGLPSQFKLFIVHSGSMAPAVKAGSIAVVKPQEDYEVGDVVTYRVSMSADIKNPRNTVTHRIVEKTSQDDAVTYTTKGDANDVEDFKPVSPELILGKVRLSIPLVGYPVSYAKTQTGFILLIVIPATLIVYTELASIKNEAKRLMQERKKRKLTTKEKIEEKIGEEIMEVEEEVKTEFEKLTKKGKKKNAKTQK